jgi:hypothetical protein
LNKGIFIQSIRLTGYEINSGIQFNQRNAVVHQGESPEKTKAKKIAFIDLIRAMSVS